MKQNSESSSKNTEKAGQSAILQKFLESVRDVAFAGDFMTFPLAKMPSVFSSNFVVFDVDLSEDFSCPALLAKIGLFQFSATKAGSEFCLRLTKSDGKEVFVVSEPNLLKIEDFKAAAETFDLKSEDSVKVIIIKEGSPSFLGAESDLDYFSNLVSYLLHHAGISIVECDTNLVPQTYSWLLSTIKEKENQKLKD